MWKLRIPNKTKVFGWKACHEILPTRLNLTKRQVVDDNICLNCTRFLESVIHVLWDCDVAQDMWDGSILKLQKCSHGQSVMIQLIEYLLNQLSLQDLDLFLV